MNIEEVINILKKYISFSEKECNFPSIWDWNWHMELANDIETLLTAYEKEKEKNKSLEQENKNLNVVRLQYLVSSFPDTTETYKKYKKELDEILKEE